MSAEFAILVAAFACFIALLGLLRSRRLARRVAILEDRMASLGRDAPPEPAAETAPEPAEQAPETAETDTQRPSPWSRGKRETSPLWRGLFNWIKANWIYPVAGAALIMAAVYLVQYSIERGLLSPQARIALALLLGAVLVACGEFIRRRWGDEGSSARLLPSTLSGAGIVALLAAILAAFHLYAMLSPTVALLGLAAVSAFAMGLGWVHGPLLATIGVVAGVSAPFLIGGGGAPSDMLYAYFGLIAVFGLGIDGFKRWGWVSALAVVAPMVAGVLIRFAGAGAFGLSALTILVALLAMALPSGVLIPRGEGARICTWRKAQPSAPTLVSALALALSSAILFLVQDTIVLLLSLGVLAMIVPLWTRFAPVLSDQGLMPVLASLAAVAVAGITLQSGVSLILAERPWLPFAAMALAVVAGAAMVWRSRLAIGGWRDFWAMLGIGYPGAMLVAFELFWSLSLWSDAATWSLAAMALASAYAGVALWAAKHDSGQGLLLGASATAAFAMIALALMLSLSFSALTLALAGLMIIAAAMDRRFDIPLLGWFLALGSMAIGWRIVVNPGLSWMLGWDGSGSATAIEVILSVLAAIGGPAVALALTAGLARGKLRDWSSVIVETGLAGMLPISLSVLIARFFFDTISIHAHLGLQACVLIILAWVQMRRAEHLRDSRALGLVRRVLAFFFGAGAGAMIVGATVYFSPLSTNGWSADAVVGVILLNDLLLAYALPGATLIWVLRHATIRVAGLGRIIGYGLLVYWIGVVIRHMWQGGTGMSMSRGFAQGELYAYTVALLIAGAIALAMALRVGRTQYRIAGLALIAIAASKAFLIDASGLTGLMRVGAFLGLGGALVGLAWLNAWVAARMGRGPDIH